MELPAELTRLKHRLEQYREGAVLPWLNFPSSDARADPSHFSKVGECDGVYTPWLSNGRAGARLLLEQLQRSRLAHGNQAAAVDARAHLHPLIRHMRVQVLEYSVGG